MNSVRENIIAQLGTDLPKLTTVNKYANTLLAANIKKGYSSLNQVNDFPSAFYGIGGEKFLESDESGGAINNKCDAYIGVHFQSENLVDEYEKWIRDLKRFILQDSKMTEFLDLHTVSGVEAWEYEGVEPFLDFEKNTGSLIVIFKIDYLEGIADGL